MMHLWSGGAVVLLKSMIRFLVVLYLYREEFRLVHSIVGGCCWFSFLPE